jgi:predicted homoserine dehydrogenase-like protein
VSNTENAANVTIAPYGPPLLEVLTPAKEVLQPGATLDATGGSTFYGAIDRSEVIAHADLLTADLAPAALSRRSLKTTVRTDIDDVELQSGSVIGKLRARRLTGAVIG